MQDIIFRRAGTSDLPAIIALIAGDQLGPVRDEPSQPLDQRYLAAFEEIAADPNQYLAVIEDRARGRIVGCMQITFIPGLSRFGMWRAQIEVVRIARERRGEGLGRRALEWATGLCRNRRCGLVQLTTDRRRDGAREFYEKLGFTASHRGMKLNLQPMD